MSKIETRIYKISGRKEDLNTLEKLFMHMEYLGYVGASRNLMVRVDGDRNGRIRVRNENDEKLKDDRYNTEQDLGCGALSGIYDIGD